MTNKIKSFTLSELLVVMVITAIVVGMAFSVLRLVQKQIYAIGINFEKTTQMSLFEQRLWQDFNDFNTLKLNKQENKLSLKSEIDSVDYFFNDGYVLRDKDTIKLKLIIDKLYFNGKETNEGNIDAISISGENELPGYSLFVSKKNDLTFFMNKDGF